MNINEVEKYDLTYENHIQTNNNNNNNEKLKCTLSKQTPEHFSSQMKKLNDEQKIIVDDILYRINKFPLKTLHSFLIEGLGIIKKLHLCVLYKKIVTILYI